MRLQFRLVLLFAGLFTVFIGVLALLHAAQARSSDSLKKELTWEKRQQLTQVVAITGSTLERFVSDYTQWDELCTFVHTADPEWAKINIEQSLASWGFQFGWVSNAEKQEIYRNAQPPLASADLADFPSPEVRTRICTTEATRFFTNTAHGVLEIRTAPIHPSDENRMGEPPQGWFMAGRLWGPEQLSQIGELTGSTIAFTENPGHPTAATEPSRIIVRLPLPAIDGRPLCWLVLQHKSQLVANMIGTDRDEAWLLTLFGVVFLAFAAWFVHRWIRRPLHLIEASLQSGRPELTASLENKRDEFARVAQLVHTVAAQRQELSREVQDRSYAESELRHAIAERAALGRDLHDGVIQSIYAIGMALQGVGPLVHSAPEEANRRITTCVDGLNHTINQLRAHIAGLEQSEVDIPSLDEGLQKLIQEMNPSRAVKFQLNLDPALVAALLPDPVVQLIFVAREAISNALRHGAPRRITLNLLRENNEAVFIIADDGRGFDAALTTSRGHGLDNMTRRAEEIGATLSLDSAPDQGTRLRVELPGVCLVDRPNPPKPTAP